MGCGASTLNASVKGNGPFCKQPALPAGKKACHDDIAYDPRDAQGDFGPAPRYCNIGPTEEVKTGSKRHAIFPENDHNQLYLFEKFPHHFEQEYSLNRSAELTEANEQKDSHSTGGKSSPSLQQTTGSIRYFYNDSRIFDFVIEDKFGPDSKVKNLGRTSFASGKDGGSVAVLRIHPGETQPFISGHVNGYHFKVHSEDPSDDYVKELRVEHRKDIDNNEKQISKAAIGDRSDPEQVLKGCEEQEIKFIDPTFSPGDDMIVRQGIDETVKPMPSWSRPEQYLPEKLRPYITPYYHISPRDVDPGRLGDLYFACALACLAEFPERVASFFRYSTNKLPHAEAEAGAYRITLNKGGWWESHLIDSYFPTISTYPCYISNKERAWDLWPQLIEKAYAHAHGSYGAIASGDVLQALQDLTGYVYCRINDELHQGKKQVCGNLVESLPIEVLYPQGTPREQKAAEGEARKDNATPVAMYERPNDGQKPPPPALRLLTKIVDWIKEGCIVVIGSSVHANKSENKPLKQKKISDDSGDKADTAEANRNDYDIIPGGYYYYLQAVVTADDHHMLRFRNPWGAQSAWKGDWSATDINKWKSYSKVASACKMNVSQMENDLKLKEQQEVDRKAMATGNANWDIAEIKKREDRAKIVVKEPDHFWMEWCDVLRYFNVGGALFNNNFMLNDYRVHGVADSADGIPNFVMELHVRKASQIIISMHQPDNRTEEPEGGKKGGGKYAPIMIAVSYNPEREIQERERKAKKLHLPADGHLRGPQQRIDMHSTLHLDEPSANPYYVEGRDVAMRYRLVPERSPYLIIPRFYPTESNASGEQHFALSLQTELSAEGTIDINFKELPKDCPAFQHCSAFLFDHTHVPPIVVSYQMRRGVSIPVITTRMGNHIED